jgi:hypothetical protein
MTMRRVLGLVVFMLGLTTPMTSASAARTCTPVHFEKGRFWAKVTGLAPPNEALCYTFRAKAGQTARLVVRGQNMIVSVIDVGDAQTTWTFKTQAKTYQFVVGQLMSSVKSEPFTVDVSVR